MNEDAAGMKRSIIIAIIVAAILVPATVYAASPLFVSSTINEPLPVVKTGESSTAQDGAEIEDEMMEKDKDAMVEDDSMPANRWKKKRRWSKMKRWPRKKTQ